MTIYLKKSSYDCNRQSDIVELLYSTDPELLQLWYGNKVKDVLQQRLTLNLLTRYLLEIWDEQTFVGIVIIYPVSALADSGVQGTADIRKILGWAQFFKKRTIYKKSARMFSGDIPKHYFYIQGFAIAPKYQGNGVGSTVLQQLKKRYLNLALYVSESNNRAQQFYVKNGFKPTFYGQMSYRKQAFGEYLMLT
ncbi:Acetyltransferase (GNAT) family protein [Amphibacillus marinus]|uniref:Acetyltransferase (GNAT) family protein n=1 Tax=Amphibacillus marinus TaxID=872970 RepID=A0A1H8TYK6_9BACI|nr:N-acetyltransferase [Amphibacillus marinus]SEO95977.1 Acetyltransferase (GNAT) family protein [Amphibacillus marinus]